jgi:hypothetical protein
MKKFLKKFPLTIYSLVAIAIALIFVLTGDEQRDELSLIDPVFWVFVLNAPLIVVGKIYTWLGIKYSLLLAIPFFLILDFILLFLRTKLIPMLRFGSSIQH